MYFSTVAVTLAIQVASAFDSISFVTPYLLNKAPYVVPAAASTDFFVCVHSKTAPPAEDMLGTGECTPINLTIGDENTTCCVGKGGCAYVPMGSMSSSGEVSSDVPLTIIPFNTTVNYITASDGGVPTKPDSQHSSSISVTPLNVTVNADVTPVGDNTTYILSQFNNTRQWISGDLASALALNSTLVFYSYFTEAGQQRQFKMTWKCTNTYLEHFTYHQLVSTTASFGPGWIPTVVDAQLSPQAQALGAFKGENLFATIFVSVDLDIAATYAVSFRDGRPTTGWIEVTLAAPTSTNPPAENKSNVNVKLLVPLLIVFVGLPSLIGCGITMHLFRRRREEVSYEGCSSGGV